MYAAPKISKTSLPSYLFLETFYFQPVFFPSISFHVIFFAGWGGVQGHQTPPIKRPPKRVLPHSRHVLLWFHLDLLFYGSGSRPRTWRWSAPGALHLFCGWRCWCGCWCRGNLRGFGAVFWWGGRRDEGLVGWGSLGGRSLWDGWRLGRCWETNHWHLWGKLIEPVEVNFAAKATWVWVAGVFPPVPIFFEKYDHIVKLDSISPSEIRGKNDNNLFWNKPLPSHCDHSHGMQNVLREKRWNCTHSDLWTTPDLPVRWWTSPSRPRLDRWGSSVVDRRALSPRTTIRWAGRWFFLLDPPCSDPSSYVQSSQVPSTAPRATRSYETLPKVDSNDGYSNIARYSPWRLLHQPIWQICSNWIAFPQLLRWCFF